MKTILRDATSICVLLFSSFAAYAELLKFEVIDIESPYFDGRSFGAVGQYEMITARATPATPVEFGHCRYRPGTDKRRWPRGSYRGRGHLAAR
jgi:hypothetical protein